MREQPTGLCQCGCGQPTGLAQRNNIEQGYVKGQPVRFKQGHGGHEKLRKPIESLYTVEDRGHTTPCWTWQGGNSGNGYGRASYEGKLHTAHRLFFEQRFGPVDDGLHLDHLCRNRACVNPDHLEAVTPTENIRRSRSTKLTQSEVDEIRAVKEQLLARAPLTRAGKRRQRVPNGIAVRERLAARYDVTADYIKVIWRGDQWR